MDTVWLLLRVTLSLAVVLGLVWIAGRRLSGSRASRRSDEPNVQVIDRSALGRHAGVAVLAVGNRRILVGYGEQRVEMLTELTPVVTPLAAPQRSGAGVPRSRATGADARTTVAGLVASTAGAAAHPATTVHPTATVRAAAPAPVPAAALAGTARDRDLRAPRFIPLSPTEEAVVRGASPLAGSVLSPQTWKDAVHALQERTVRR